MMQIFSSISNLTNGIKKVYRKAPSKIVLMPYDEYDSLREKLEGLQDIKDHQKAMKEYHLVKGKPFR